MADFYPAALQLQYPDLLKSYVQGQMAPLAVQGAQQENVERGLKIDQLRQIMRGQQLQAEAWRPQDASAQPSASAGIQNGPQAAVGAETSPQMNSGSIPPGMPGAVGASQTPMAPLSQSSTYTGSQSAIHPATQAMVNGLSPDMGKLLYGTALSGGDAFARLKEIQDSQLRQGQLQWSMDNSPMGEAFGRHMATSPDAPQTLQANWKTLGPIWMQTAFNAGVDARDMSPHNVNKLAAMLYNQRAIPLGMAPISAPAAWRSRDIGLGGTEQVQLDTGETKPGVAREMPVKVGERFDPDTGQNVAVYKQFAPSAPQGQMGAFSQGTSGSATSAGTIEIPVGLTPPTADQTRAAGLAMSMRTGLDNLRNIERSGFNLTPSDRAAIVGVISEQGGPLGILTGGALSSLPLQELLAHKLSPQGQTYLASLMPVLQGIGHHLGGQRLNDVQIKALLESIAPINTSNAAAMAQINANRNGYYSGLLAETGSAREMRVFGGALKADYEKLGKINAEEFYSKIRNLPGGASEMPSRSEIEAEIARRRKPA